MIGRLRQAGEAGLGKLTQRLMADPRFLSAVQALAERSVRTREQVEAMTGLVLGAISVPSRAELERLGRKVDELEAAIEALALRLEAHDEHGQPAGGSEAP